MILQKPHQVFHLWPKILSANQIATFFGHQYLWKESNDMLVFLYEVSHQGKVASKTTTQGFPNSMGRDFFYWLVGI